MSKPKTIKLEKNFRMAQINLARSYVYAAEMVSAQVKSSIDDLTNTKWRNEIVILPILSLLRQAIELAIKSIFVSHNEAFLAIHDLKELVKAAEETLKKDREINFDHNQTKWNEISSIANDFAETRYGKDRMFTQDDISSTTLRYLQTDDFDNYSELKNIPYENLIERVKRAVNLCEAFTLNTATHSYYEP